MQNIIYQGLVNSASPFFMKHFILFLVLSGLMAFKDITTVKSNLFIPAGEQFHLGGGQNYDFRLEAKNLGQYSVELFLENNGKQTPLGNLEKNQNARLVIPKNHSLVLNNKSKSRAHIKVHIKGKSENLGMYYSAAESEN